MINVKTIILALTGALLLLLAGCAQNVSNEGSIDSQTGERVLAGSVTKYIDFNKESYDRAIAENKTILLYFYASWCPICRAEQPKTFAAFNEINYPDVVGFRVNYRDSDVDEYEEQLAKEHGVTYQHTKVIIKDGKRILKAPDSWTKEKYLEEIGKAAQ